MLHHTAAWVACSAWVEAAAAQGVFWYGSSLGIPIVEGQSAFDEATINVACAVVPATCGVNTKIVIA